MYTQLYTNFSKIYTRLYTNFPKIDTRSYTNCKNCENRYRSLYQNHENRYRSLYQNREKRYPSRWHVPVPKLCIVPPPPPGSQPGLSADTLKTPCAALVGNLGQYDAGRLHHSHIAQTTAKERRYISRLLSLNLLSNLFVAA